MPAPGRAGGRAGGASGRQRRRHPAAGLTLRAVADAINAGARGSMYRRRGVELTEPEQLNRCSADTRQADRDGCEGVDEKESDGEGGDERVGEGEDGRWAEEVSAEASSEASAEANEDEGETAGTSFEWQAEQAQWLIDHLVEAATRFNPDLGIGEAVEDTRGGWGGRGHPGDGNKRGRAEDSPRASLAVVSLQAKVLDFQQANGGATGPAEPTTKPPVSSSAPLIIGPPPQRRASRDPPGPDVVDGGGGAGGAGRLGAQVAVVLVVATDPKDGTVMWGADAAAGGRPGHVATVEFSDPRPEHVELRAKWE